MTKSFKQYLARVDLALALVNRWRNDDDLRLFLYCRLQTVSDHHKAKSGPEATAAMLFRQYSALVAQGPQACWWRFRAGL